MAAIANPVSALNTEPSSYGMMHQKSSTSGRTRINHALDYQGVHEAIPFPWKLHTVLEEAEGSDFTNIVSWLPDHCSFRVHHPEAFVKLVMPKYFRQTKYKSFQRQLNMWGFERLISGPHKGGYSHEQFVRGQPALCHNMKRLKIKGTGNKSAVSLGPLPSMSSKSVQPPRPSSNAAFSLDGWTGNRNAVSLGHLPSMSSKSVQPPLPSSNATLSLDRSLDEQALFDEETLLSVLSSAFDNNPATTTPEEGDLVLFEGMQFCFVDDYNNDDMPLPANTPQGSSRRFSIEFQGNSSGGRRRMSLVGTMGYASSNVNRRLSIELSQEQPAMPKRHRTGRRFSLARGAGDPKDFNNFVLKEMHNLFEL